MCLNSLSHSDHIFHMPGATVLASHPYAGMVFLFRLPKARWRLTVMASCDDSLIGIEPLLPHHIWSGGRCEMTAEVDNHSALQAASHDAVRALAEGARQMIALSVAKPGNTELWLAEALQLLDKRLKKPM